MILLSHPTGNAYVRNAAAALYRAGLLKEFWTCFSWDNGSAMNIFMPEAFRRHLSRRTFPDVPRALIRTAPWRELGRFLAPVLGAGSLTRHETGPFSVDAVYRAFDRRIARRVVDARNLKAIFCAEDYALESFSAAQERGIGRLYELPIGYWRLARKIYEEERIREPEWASTLSGCKDSEQKLERKDEELRLADVVLVASDFTKRSLDACPSFRATVHVLPYGAPPPTAEPCSASKSGPLRVLFVGGLSQRKGLSYLLDAVKLLQPDIELTLIGRKNEDSCRPLDEATTRYRWIPSLPHAEVLAEMRKHDVLVFPSLFEGFGLVILEAMSQGLPVITTDHTAGPDLLTEGEDGFIVPIRSGQAIAEKLSLLASNRGLLEEMKRSALHTAERHGWKFYRERMASLAKAFLAGAVEKEENQNNCGSTKDSFLTTGKSGNL